jgi:DNA-binding CsgD family transcriptional regulator
MQVMVTLRNRDYGDLLSLIHSIGLPRKSREDQEAMLSFLVRFFDANSLVCFVAGSEEEEIDWAATISVNTEREWAMRYRDHYRREDPLYQDQFLSGGDVFKTDDVIPYSRLVKSEYYHDFLRPQRAFSELIIRLRSHGRFFGVIDVMRSKEQPVFDARDVLRAALLAPHITNSLENTALLLELREERDTLRGMLNGAPESPGNPPLPRCPALTRREGEIVRCVARGLTNKEIARLLSISLLTVETHLKNIFQKTGASNRVHLLSCVEQGQLPSHTPSQSHSLFKL